MKSNSYDSNDDIANYAIEIDPDVLLQDYDDADAIQHELDEEYKTDTDIEFE